MTCKTWSIQKDIVFGPHPLNAAVHTPSIKVHKMRTTPACVLLLSSALLALSLSSSFAASAPTSSEGQQHVYSSREPIPIAKAPESFHEELVLKPMNDGSVYSHVQFTTHIGTMMDEDRFDGASSNLCKVPRP